MSTIALSDLLEYLYDTDKPLKIQIKDQLFTI